MDKPKFSADEAWKVAAPLVLALKPFCERIEIAGSLRRRKPMVGDIEILFVPKMADSKIDFFSTYQVSLPDTLIGAWLDQGLIAKRPSKIGVFTWGPQNKLAIHKPSGIPIDFFSTTEPKWWNSLVCRTGGKDNNLLVTKTALRQGYSFEAYGTGYRNLRGGEDHQTTSERDVFEFIGLAYWEPWERI